MNEPLTIFGECKAVPWTVDQKQTFSIVTHDGNALYWEWKCEEKGLGPEDFILFVRTVFPNGGAFVGSHCNESIIWSPVEGDVHAIGVRKLKANNTWIVSVLDVSEQYPGSSQCPDPKLSLLANKFIAEEFLRGTNPSDLYTCDEFICKESPNWWLYLQKLEKIIGWKLPEVKHFSQKMASTSAPSNPKYTNQKNSSRSERKPDVHSYEWGSDTYASDKRTVSQNDWTNSSQSVDYRARRHVVDARSRSPITRVVLNSRASDIQPEFISTASSANHVVSQPNKTNKLRCNRCNKEFGQTYDLMRHYNSEEHQAAVAREFPI